MDVILHIGAQRTATTTLQSYLRANGAALGDLGVGVWGPLRTRKGGLLSGIAPDAGTSVDLAHIAQARDRIHRRCADLTRHGARHLVVSDENMLGTIRMNLRTGALYSGARDRLSLFAQAFDGLVTRVVLSVRPLDAYWASAWAYAVERGHRLPKAQDLARIATNARGWQDVTQDVAQTFGDVEIVVLGHAHFAGRPDQKLRHMLGGTITAPRLNAPIWRHRAPDLHALRHLVQQRDDDPTLLPQGDGRWNPFDDTQTAMLRETYQDDLFWLHAGAGGLATYIEEDQPDQAGTNLPGGVTTRGRNDDRQDARLARAG